MLPLESVIRDKQTEYYEALSQADNEANSTVFVEFMLESIQAVLNQHIQQSDQATDQVSDQVGKLLNIMNNDWLSRAEMMVRLGLSHQPTFRKNYLKPALHAGLVIMKNPNSPRSPKQKYRKV